MAEIENRVAEFALRRLTSPAGSDYPWTHPAVGADLADQLAELTDSLKQPPNSEGRGKCIQSGFSYWGVESTVAWCEAVSDRFYPVMRESHERFAQRWREVSKHVAGREFHYVSLGPGTGEKDAAILADLAAQNPDTCYIPVDMSAEMLRIPIHRPLRSMRIDPVRIIPIQIDFSDEAIVTELRRRLDWLLPDGKFVFSLLGNTIANFDRDDELLEMLADILLKPDDMLVMEVATTTSSDLQHANRAADEYRKSRRFREFVTCSLQHYTDLTIDLEKPGLEFNGRAEDEHAIAISMLYRNTTEQSIRITLPDRSTVEFPPDDTIRLYLTRKYLPSGIDRLISRAKLRKIAHQHVDFQGPGTRRGGHFGMDLLVLSRARPGEREPNLADQVLRRR